MLVTGLLYTACTPSWCPHTQRDEYSYLTSLLADMQRSNEELM